ncbi:MAG: hypothetical protein DWQ47_15365 [Acidobacteria bacterium]|nr:MAG: hypothetical protein DWQ32_02765 [Acidobacteriota bacterium]REK02559.1 MAG: hypothetical protein DWQ38_09370 [Acidobacteriota bacterium]REK13638.1 MAG: hypothetical protein DWQ43_08455 [Acidobacteriota bacterium]REK41632.1 MAG: hypothetical protein DWQ47_15365 [Acidobacteriota bacterium]
MIDFAEDQMSRFEVELNDEQETPVFSAVEDASKSASRRRIILRVVSVLSLLVIVVAVGAAIAGVFYYRSLVDSPQYVLAQIVNAAHNSNDEKIAELVDTDAVVEDFVPQVTDKAIEMYGRGLPKETIAKAKIVATPILPVVKQRARAELPGLLRDRTESLKNVPFWGLVVGADQYLQIETEGDRSVIKSQSEERPLELVLARSEGQWRVVAVRDEELARNVAGRIGQELIFLAKKAGEGKVDDVGRRLGIDGIGDLLKKAEEIFR